MPARGRTPASVCNLFGTPICLQDLKLAVKLINKDFYKIPEVIHIINSFILDLQIYINT